MAKKRIYTRRRCRSCDFWVLNHDREDLIYSASEEIYVPTQRAYDVGNCLCDSFVYGSSMGFCPQDGLVYWDQDMFAASFKTGEDFGCIHHTKRRRYARKIGEG